MKNLTEEELKAIIKFAFKAGENWGYTYGGWFTPSKDDTQIKIDNAINQVFEFDELNP